MHLQIKKHVVVALENVSRGVGSSHGDNLGSMAQVKTMKTKTQSHRLGTLTAKKTVWLSLCSGLVKAFIGCRTVGEALYRALYYL